MAKTEILTKDGLTIYNEKMKSYVEEKIDENIDEVNAELDIIKQSIIDIDATNEASGSHILLTDSADGVVTDFEGYGRTEQKQYTGKNLITNTSASKTTNGLIITANKDGSVTINGTATAETRYNLFPLVDLEPNQYILTGLPAGASENTYCYLIHYHDNASQTFVSESDYPVSIGTSTQLSIDIYIANGASVPNLTFYPMLRLIGTSNTFEPYTNKTPAPNPDYPQEIVSAGDKGWFDGELLQGYYDTDGTVNGTSYYVSAKNLMPCRANDVIKFSYAENVTKLVVLFFDDTEYLSQVGADNSSQVYATVPSGATRFGITIQNSSGITPATAKKITVTINDKYALIVKSIGKNIFNNILNSVTKNEVTATLNKDKSITIVGSPTENTAFYLGDVTLSAGNYILNDYPSDIMGYMYLSGNRTTYASVDKSNSEKGFTLNSETTLANHFVAIKGTTYNHTIRPMIRLAEVTDDTYEPYKESVKYIPLNEPLRSSLDGTVTDVVDLGKCEITRKFKEVVFDGSDDEGWTLNGYNANGYTTNGEGIAISLFQRNDTKLPIITEFDTVKRVISDKLIATSRSKERLVNSCCVANNQRLFICLEGTIPLADFKAQLQANPITVVYELAEPVVEPIEPIAIATYDSTTYITNADNADMRAEYYINSPLGQSLSNTNANIRAGQQYLLDHMGGSQYDVVDNLESTSSNLPLSARQGKVLNESINALNTDLVKKANGYSWTALTKGVTWSRICLCTPTVGTTGGAFLLNVGFTRGNTVANASFLFTTSHAGANFCFITQLSSNNYSPFKIRGVCSKYGTCYVEIYDYVNNITSSTSQTVNCTLIPLLDYTVTRYEAFTSGDTIPSGYVAYEHSVTTGGAMVAPKFVGNLAGNASTATSATTATQLGSNAGSATQPVYFSGGKPVATTYTLGASVPSGAKFTDTTYSAMTGATSSAAGSGGLVPAPAAGKQTSFLRGDGTWQSVVTPADIVNNLTSTATNVPLSANQGRVLNASITTANTELAKKVNTADIVNHLQSTATDLPLSARQGRVLNERISERISEINKINTEVAKKINTADIVDNLQSTRTDLPLSANQGAVLNEKISGVTQVFLMSANTSKTITLSNVGNGCLISVIGSNSPSAYGLYSFAHAGPYVFSKFVENISANVFSVSHSGGIVTIESGDFNIVCTIIGKGYVIS